MPAHPRYRHEDGRHHIDLRVATVEQLFDNRDPAPFRQRDLAPDLVDYLLAAAEDLAGHDPFDVVVWCASPQVPVDLERAYRAHFEYELERLARRRRRQRRTGQVALVIGVTLLVLLLSAAQLMGRLGDGGIVDAVREGLLILAWVVMWRPVEALLYEWLPLHRQHRLLTRLRDAPIHVRA
jgi:predicted nucleotidyltransferase